MARAVATSGGQVRDGAPRAGGGRARSGKPGRRARFAAAGVAPRASRRHRSARLRARAPRATGGARRNGRAHPCRRLGPPGERATSGRSHPLARRTPAPVRPGDGVASRGAGRVATGSALRRGGVAVLSIAALQHVRTAGVLGHARGPARQRPRADAGRRARPARAPPRSRRRARERARRRPRVERALPCGGTTPPSRRPGPL